MVLLSFKLFRLILLCYLLCYAGTLYCAEKNNEIIIEDEVLIISQELQHDIELKKETQKLLSVAGAATDPLQAVFALPGVTFTSGFGGGEPIIRGSAPQDNAYYIDSLPASYLFHPFGNSILNKNIIDTFELYPAAFPSEFDNATGGVIDVKLRDPENVDLTTVIDFSFLSAGIFIESGLSDNQQFYAAFRKSLLDKFISEEDIIDEEEGITIDKLPVYDDYQFKYAWNINSQHTFSIVGAGAGDTAAATFNDNNNEVQRDPDFEGPADFEQGFDSQGIFWDWKSENKKLKTLITHIKDNTEFNYGNNQSQNIVSKRFILRSFYQQEVNKKNNFSLGFSYLKDQLNIDINAKIVSCSDFDPDCPTVDAEFITYQDRLNIQRYTGFIENISTLNDKSQLTLGLHYSSDDYLNEKALEPRIRWDYQLDSTWDTYFAAGKYSQLPQLNEIIDVIGNPNLNRIKADHYVWGIEYKLNNGWSWKTDLYYKNLSQVVISVNDMTSEDFFLNYTNEAKGKAYGMEIVLNKNMTNRWFGWLALTFSETQRKNLRTGKKNAFEYDKPIMANVVFNYTFSDKLTAGFKWLYQSGAFYTPIIDVASNNSLDILEPIYGELNSERLPAYHRLDFRVEYLTQTNWGKAKFFADILNLYNRQVVEEYEFSPRGGNVLQTVPKGFGENVPIRAEKSLGIIPSLGVEITF